MRTRKRVRKSKQRGGRIPDSWEISIFLQDGAREAGVFEGEDDDEDYDYNYPTSDWFESNFDEVVTNMMTEFSATREDIFEGLRTWYNGGSEGMDYYFGWIEDRLVPTNEQFNESNEESNNEPGAVSNVGPIVSNVLEDPSNPRGGRRRSIHSRRSKNRSLDLIEWNFRRFRKHFSRRRKHGRTCMNPLKHF
jgi:hypothetical protein